MNELEIFKYIGEDIRTIGDIRRKFKFADCTVRRTLHRLQKAGLIEIVAIYRPNPRGNAATRGWQWTEAGRQELARIVDGTCIGSWDLWARLSAIGYQNATNFRRGQ